MKLLALVFLVVGPAACTPGTDGGRTQPDDRRVAAYTAVHEIWERQDSYQGSRPVWDPSVNSYVDIDHDEVYQLDLAPPRVFTDRAEIWTPNYRCMHTNLVDQPGWHRDRQQNQDDWRYGPDLPSWCQRIDFNPWFQPASYYPDSGRWWTQATAATWYSAQIWNNGKPHYFALIRFTENKTLRGADDVLRRAAPPLDHWGYANWKMDGTPVSPALEIAQADTTDGYYQGFVTVSTLPSHSSNNWGANSLAHDHGPIVWPRRGYRQWRSDLGHPPGQGAAWQQTSAGCRHPHAFMWGGFLYVFYLADAGVAPDGSHDPPDQGGIFVARSPVSSGMKPGSWMCGPGFDTPCLPAGYSTASRALWESALALPGPAVQPVLSSQAHPGITSFSVAAIASSGHGPQMFLGVAETFTGWTARIELFTSTDLVAWNHHSTALTTPGGWDQAGAVHYPAPISASDGDPTLINGSWFHIVGGAGGPGCRSWHCRVNRITVTDLLTQSPPAQQPPLPPPAPSGSSCAGHCGSKAESCYCDAACSSFGDCCADHAAVCGAPGVQSPPPQDPPPQNPPPQDPPPQDPPPSPSSTGPVIGHLDGINSSGQLAGWACFVGAAKPIDVHVYVGGPAGSPGATFIGAVTPTAQPSEQAIHALCQTPATIKHRFLFALDPQLAAHAGKPIYVHGIVPSPATGTNDLIGNSGAVTVASAAPAPYPAPNPASSSCAGACGAQAPAGCWCDQSCEAYGDCCTDHAAVCQ